jgi:glycosyltransferase involved in cell wall biosynthesis
VSDYTRLVAAGLGTSGDEVAVYAPPAGISQADRGVTVRRLPDHFSPGGLATLDRWLRTGPRPDRILIQYVPHAFGWKAMNLPFAAWVAARARRIAPVWVMAHEVAFPFAWRPRTHAILGAATAVMARLIFGAADRMFVSIPGWGPRIRRICHRAQPAEWLAIPSNVPAAADAAEVAAVRRQYGRDGTATLVGHFGTFGAPITDVLGPAAAELLARRATAQLFLVGRGSDRFRDDLANRHPALAGRVTATGELPAERLPAHLRACDLLLQPYPDGVSSRRTSVMAGLANAVPVATNLGFLSESLWATAAGIVVAPAADPAALAAAAATVLDLSPAARASLGRRAAELYASSFSVDRVISALRGV